MLDPRVTGNDLVEQQCHDLKGYLACVWVEIMIVALQNSIIHKDTETLYTSVLYYRLPQIVQKKPSSM